MPEQPDPARSIAAKVSHQLLEIKAIAIDTVNLFRYVSGILSPIYVDNRRTISFPAARRLVVDCLVETLKADIQLDHFDIVAGVATGGIPWAAWVADRLELPLVYVRPLPKDRGMKKQVEGILEPGQRAVIIEDLITTGLSSVNAAEAVRSEEGQVEYCLSIFAFQPPSALHRFNEHQLTPYSLTTLPTLLATAQSEGYITADQLKAVELWASTTLANEA
jgi:orotate phosphoribosyltransferase